MWIENQEARTRSQEKKEEVDKLSKTNELDRSVGGLAKSCPICRLPG
jgi:hypothetical protein